jgi:hypothetical protein
MIYDFLSHWSEDNIVCSSKSFRTDSSSKKILLCFLSSLQIHPPAFKILLQEFEFLLDFING